MTGTRHARRRHRSIQLVVTTVSCVLLLATGLASCGSASDDGSGSAATKTAAPSESVAPATSSARAESEKASRALTEIGARYAQALTEHGIPADALADDATLSQLARGICDQTAAGTSDAELRQRLEPVIRYSKSLVDKAQSEQDLTETFLTAARTNVC